MHRLDHYNYVKAYINDFKPEGKQLRTAKCALTSSDAADESAVKPCLLLFQSRRARTRGSSCFVSSAAY